MSKESESNLEVGAFEASVIDGKKEPKASV
jgi:hypothetical protein